MPDAKIRWQPAHVDFWPAVQQPDASDCAGRKCVLVWVVEEDWRQLLEQTKGAAQIEPPVSVGGEA